MMKKIKIKEVKYNNPEFYRLCKCLEKEHNEVVREQRAINGNCLINLDKFTHVLLYIEDGRAIGSLAISKPVNGTVEIGRVYVMPEYRNKKIATILFDKAFQIMENEGNNTAILSTYGRFEAAVHLYKKLGFKIVETFEHLKNSPYSICMKKSFLNN